jgi:hypothetical protein
MLFPPRRWPISVITSRSDVGTSSGQFGRSRRPNGACSCSLADSEWPRICAVPAGAGMPQRSQCQDSSTARAPVHNQETATTPPSVPQQVASVGPNPITNLAWHHRPGRRTFDGSKHKASPRRRRLPGNVTPPEAEESMTSSPQLGSAAVHSETLAKSRRRE